MGLMFCRTNRVFWGYKSPANGPLGSAKPNRDVLGYNPPPRTLRFRRTQSGVLGLEIPCQWALGFRKT
ncbi:Hypothetical protein FKW44_024488 [Caligus rogercresseyi]|uniref:Uncharacterized protein n=1 Tax=Caligus rogercresseyi TaxID=217165 RepID=A0A7T8GMS7_CALRO|nr:Hypothetical protein FKW44_024488 [Caligus rogercresseyi]